MSPEAVKTTLEQFWDAVDAKQPAAAAELLIRLQTEAVEEERKRIIKGIRVSRDSMPIWSHVDSYGLGQVLKGNPWPEDR